MTALYTSQAWVWGELSCAKLFETKEGRAVFAWTNAALWIARLFLWRLRSLKHSLIHRHVLLDTLVERSGLRRVLELASGLSRRGAAMSSTGIRYTEVDLPHVAEKKRTLLERTEAGHEVLARDNWQLVAADVTTLDLAELVPPDEPTFVITEGLLMYLEPDEQRALWRRIADVLVAGGVLAFDLVPWVEQPKPGPIGRALEWLMKKFTKGKSFERDSRTRSDLLVECGFDRVQVLEPCVVGTRWGLPFPTVETSQLVFVCYRGHPEIRPE